MPRSKIYFLLNCLLAFLFSCTSTPTTLENFQTESSPILEKYRVDDADIYFVPIGPVSQKYLVSLVNYYQNIFKLKIKIAQPLPYYEDYINSDRRQLRAEMLVDKMKELYLEQSGRQNSIFIGITHLDMYIVSESWRYAYAYRFGKNLAVVSSARIENRWSADIVFPDGDVALIEKVHPELRKLVTKTLGLLFFQKPLNSNPRSIMYSKILGYGDLLSIDEETIYGDILPERVENYAVVNFARVFVPRNRILLIRRKESLCALQFTSFRKEEHKLGIFEAGVPMEYYGDYDWYFTHINKGRFIGDEVESGHDNVSHLPGVGFIYHGIGVGFSRDNSEIECGDLTLNWAYPNGIENISKGWPEHLDLEYAPTRWQDISQVDANDPSIKWYGPKSSISNKFIPLEDLPPFELSLYK